MVLHLQYDVNGIARNPLPTITASTGRMPSVQEC